MISNSAAVWYAGLADGTVAVIDGISEAPLHHHVRHSPTGFSWGYGGSGPAELARCLLIDALGDQAQCQACDGTGKVVYGPGDKVLSVAAAEAVWEQFSDPVSCLHCDEGCVVTPTMYQQFKTDVVSRFTMDHPWSMPQSEVRNWWRRHAMREVK